MNRYLRALVVIPCGMVKMGWTKLFHPKYFHGTPICMISPLAEISMNYGGQLSVGRGFKMRDGAKLRVRKGAKCFISKRVTIGSNCIITCHKEITIGDHTQLSTNVQIYDHDHDFRTSGGIASMQYKTGSVEIGNNVWIGANTVILRETKIGDNCVVGAGCVLKGDYPAGTVIVQKRETTVTKYNE